MDYVIRNNRGVYIKIDSGGRPVSCNFKDRTLMDRNKARNILNSLPKSLKKLNFIMEAIPDIPPRVIETPQTYKPSENITRWVEQFGTCGDIFNSAVKRSNELIGILYDLDKGLLNIGSSIRQFVRIVLREEKRKTKFRLFRMYYQVLILNVFSVSESRKPWMDFSIENIHIESSKDRKMMRTKQKYITIR